RAVGHGAAASLPSLIGESARLHALALARLTASPGDRPRTDDRVLDVPETARRMGVSRDYVYRRASEWPFTVRRGRKLGFSELRLTEYLHRMQGRTVSF